MILVLLIIFFFFKLNFLQPHTAIFPNEYKADQVADRALGERK
jgi:hypothetical protein